MCLSLCHIRAMNSTVLTVKKLKLSKYLSKKTNIDQIPRIRNYLQILSGVTVMKNSQVIALLVGFGTYNLILEYLSLFQYFIIYGIYLCVVVWRC